MDLELVDGVAAARAGDETAFAALVNRYRHELHVHCYRMLGSIEDAEDAVQDTLLRAWAKLSTYEGRASFRAWLYGIATNACLDSLRRRKSRAWPPSLVGPADPRQYELVATDLPWLQPYPDRWLDAAAPAAESPDSVVIAKETIELAFLAAIQHLPARQRAVLIVRDVLEWSAQETAAALEMTPAAVNSALQRAHATLADHMPSGRSDWNSASEQDERALLAKLINAWESADADALVGLLRSDARFVMPPSLVWFEGRDAVASFFRNHVFAHENPLWRIVPTFANRQPAFGLYWQFREDPAPKAFAIVLIRGDGESITHIDLFNEPRLFAAFDLPATL